MRSEVASEVLSLSWILRARSGKKTGCGYSTLLRYNNRYWTGPGANPPSMYVLMIHSAGYLGLNEEDVIVVSRKVH